MTLLVYCIMNGPADGGGVLTGAKGGEVSFVECGGLCAAVGEMPSQDGAPPVSDLLAYARVVEALHRRRAVIPMRYGCFLDGAPELRRLLKEKESQYKTLLKELEGHVEMGIRILLPERAEKPPKGAQPVTGRGYLAARKAYYGLSEDVSRHHKMLLDRYNQAFSGLCSKLRTEADERGDRAVVSLYYLTPESAVGPFREAFARAVPAEGAKTFVSGPWPPYNFATPNPVPAEGQT